MLFPLSFLKKHWTFLVLIIFFGYLFANLLSSHMLLPENGGLYSGGSTWGDLAFHLSLISSFAFGNNLQEWQHPVFAGEKLSYPFVSDLASAALIKLGTDIRWGLILPSFFFLIILVFLIYFLSWKIIGDKLSAFFVPFLFLFNGSIFGLYYFWQDFKASGLPLLNFLGNMQKEYSHLADFNLRFSNIIADYLMPQRAIILGLILGTLSIYFFWNYFETKERKNLLKAGVSVAFLPLVHTHSFLSLILVALFLIIIRFGQNPKNLKNIFSHWLYFALPVIIIGLPQVLWLFPLGKESFFRFQFGWMKGEENIFLFWFRNLGLYLVLFVLAFIFARKSLKIFYLPFLVVFLLTNVIIFQPYEYDNMKIMLYWFLLSCILVADSFRQILNRLSLKGLWVIVPLFTLLISTGLLSVWRESHLKWLMYSSEDIKMADFVKQNTAKDSLFLTSDRHNHPIPSLAGRKILMGYRGWLWSHGINYSQRERDVLTMFNGGERAKELLKKYKINYAVIDPSARTDFRANELFYDQNYPIVFRSENTKIYKIK